MQKSCLWSDTGAQAPLVRQAPGLKTFTDDKINATEKFKFALGRVENIMGKGENSGYQHFLLFQQCFQKASFLKVV